MKALKVFLRVILVVIAVILVFAITIVCTYVLGAPDTQIGTEARKIVSGPWTETISKDIDADLYKFDFNQDGEFKIVKGNKQIADGWFKIDDKSHKIKMLMLPSHYTEEYAKYVKFKVLSEISYSNLKYQLAPAEFGKSPSVIKDQEPTVSLLISAVDGSEGNTLVLNCKMYEYTLDLYVSEHDLTKDN